jgi:dTDP-4-amino-4,6-dideoxygalactose transaminase
VDIPLFKIYWDESDVERVSSVIRKGMYWAIGPEIREFESKVAEYVGVKYAFAVNSGTSALHAALAAHGVGEGDEVIVPSLTFIATANAPIFVGAKPVFAEIEDVTYGLDPKDVERKITPRTKAIIPIHYGGSPCRIAELRQIAQKHGVLLIEDAAESLGAAVNGKRVGSFGDSAVVSFCAPKIITTGEGGMFLTNSKDVYKKVNLICNHGRVETEDYFSSTEHMEYVTLGYNFRMSTITAALGITQIEKIDNIIRMRQKNAQYLNEGLAAITNIKTHTVPHSYFHVYQLYTIRLVDKSSLRDELMRYLLNQNIMAKVYFYPVHLTSFYRKEFGYREGYLPMTEKISSEVLTLPVYPSLTEAEMEYIVEAVKGFFTRGGT